MSLRAKLLLPLVLLGILIAGYLYAVWIPRTLEADEVAHLRGVDRHLNSVAETLVPLLLGNQLDILHGNLDALEEDNPDWLSIRLVNPENKPLYPLATAALPQDTATSPDVRKVEKPIRYLGEHLGTLTIQVDLAPSLENTRREILELTVVLLGVLAALMLTIVATAELMVGRPVRQLADAATRLARMDFDTPLPQAGADEIGELVDSFSSMRNDLQGNRASLLREIAERKEAEEALKQLNETLELRVKNEVAANRDKDHLLIQQSRLAAMGEMVHNIAHQWRLIEKMSTTIDDFRDFFRPDREMSSFDVATSIRDAVFIVEASLKSNHIELALEAPKGMTASGFPGQYGQAVLNLLVNAKEAILEHRQTEGRIRVALGQENGAAVLTVEDNGGGIPVDILPRLFDPYFTTKDQGTGIGLYMAKMIIERNMEGTISAANIEGGARFTLSIPLERTA